MTRPPALPAAFRRLWAADALSNAGDGFTLVAAPLLMTTLTRSPILIAGTVAAQQVPWLLIGLASGAIVDRVDQRRLLIRIDAIRALLMAVLGLSIVTGTATVPLVYLLLFASGTGDTFVLTAGTTIVPTLVGRENLTRANARLIASRMVGGSLMARPIGAFLFGHGHGTPFFVDAVSFAAGVVLLLGLKVPSRRPAGPARRFRPADVVEGLALLWSDAVLRVLGLCIVAMNITLSATMAILVLVARDRYGLSATGYGLLSALAVGGLFGTVIVNPALRRFGPTVLLKVGLLIEAGTQLTLAITDSPWVAGVALLIFAVHGAVWSVLTVSIRQHRVADQVRGRVISAYTVLSVGGSAIGAVLGGVLVEAGGLSAPMWFGTAVVALVFLAALPALRPSAIDLSNGAAMLGAVGGDQGQPTLRPRRGGP